MDNYLVELERAAQAVVDDAADDGRQLLGDYVVRSALVERLEQVLAGRIVELPVSQAWQEAAMKADVDQQIANKSIDTTG